MQNSAIKSHRNENFRAVNGIAVSERDENSSKVGRPPMNSYLNADEITPPESIDQVATNREYILMNYPFIGTLLKKKNGNFRILKTYSRENNTCIEQVEQVHGPGDYQLRFIAREEEQIISFSIDEPQKEKEKQTSNSNEDVFLKEELYQSQQEVKRLKERIKDRDSELDEQLRKNRQLTQEMIELERKGEKRYQEKIERLEADRDRLKESLDDLKYKNMSMELKMEHGDTESGFDVVGMLKDVFENEQLRELATTMLSNKKNGFGAEPTKIHQLNQTRSNPDGLSDAETNRQAQHPEKNAEQIALEIMQSFVNNVFAKAVEALTAENPDYNQVAAFVQSEIKTIRSQGMQIDPQNWINIAKGLIQFSLEHGIKSERLAEVITPLLENLGMAKQALKFMPVDGAISTLKDMYSLQLTDKERSVLADILGIFKDRLSK